MALFTAVQGTGGSPADINDGATFGNASPGTQGVDYPGATDTVDLNGYTLTQYVQVPQIAGLSDTAGGGDLIITADMDVGTATDAHITISGGGTTLNGTISYTRSGAAITTSASSSSLVFAGTLTISGANNPNGIDHTHGTLNITGTINNQAAGVAVLAGANFTITSGTFTNTGGGDVIRIGTFITAGSISGTGIVIDLYGNALELGSGQTCTLDEIKNTQGTCSLPVLATLTVETLGTNIDVQAGAAPITCTTNNANIYISGAGTPDLNITTNNGTIYVTNFTGTLDVKGLVMHQSGPLTLTGLSNSGSNAGFFVMTDDLNVGTSTAHVSVASDCSDKTLSGTFNMSNASTGAVTISTGGILGDFAGTVNLSNGPQGIHVYEGYLNNMSGSIIVTTEGATAALLIDASGVLSDCTGTLDCSAVSAPYCISNAATITRFRGTLSSASSNFITNTGTINSGLFGDANGQNVTRSGVVGAGTLAAYPYTVFTEDCRSGVNVTIGAFTTTNTSTPENWVVLGTTTTRIPNASDTIDIAGYDVTQTSLPTCVAIYDSSAWRYNSQPGYFTVTDSFSCTLIQASVKIASDLTGKTLSFNIVSQGDSNAGVYPLYINSGTIDDFTGTIEPGNFGVTAPSLTLAYCDSSTIRNYSGTINVNSTLSTGLMLQSCTVGNINGTINLADVSTSTGIKIAGTTVTTFSGLISAIAGTGLHLDSGGIVTNFTGTITSTESYGNPGLLIRATARVVNFQGLIQTQNTAIMLFDARGGDAGIVNMNGRILSNTNQGILSSENGSGEIVCTGNINNTVPNLEAGNVKNGTTILGVTGTLVTGGSSKPGFGGGAFSQ